MDAVKRIGPDVKHADPSGIFPGKLLSLARHRALSQSKLPEHTADPLLGDRHLGVGMINLTPSVSGSDDDATLNDDIIDLARQYDCYDYRRVTALLREA